MMNRNVEITLYCAHQNIRAFLISRIDPCRIFAITDAHPKIARKRQQCPSTSRLVVVKHHQCVATPTRDISFVAHRRKIWIIGVDTFA